MPPGRWASHAVTQKWDWGYLSEIFFEYKSNIILSRYNFKVSKIKAKKTHNVEARIKSPIKHITPAVTDFWVCVFQPFILTRLFLQSIHWFCNMNFQELGLHSVRWGRTRAGDPPPHQPGYEKICLRGNSFLWGKDYWYRCIPPTWVGVPQEWEWETTPSSQPQLTFPAFPYHFFLHTQCSWHGELIHSELDHLSRCSLCLKLSSL